MMNEIQNEALLISNFLEIKEIKSNYESSGALIDIWYIQLPYFRTNTYSIAGRAIQEFLDKTRFHKSWEWLMAIVHHIENIKDFAGKPIYRLTIERSCCHISRFDSPVEDPIVICMGGDNKMDNVYIALLEFINWYNNQLTCGLITKS